MRIWSLHARYLDRQGLTAAWREGLLAQKVLAGGTAGYRNHPQLRRFRAAGDGAVMHDGVPGAAISSYLHGMLDEAAARGYSFDSAKVLGPRASGLRLEVTTGQLAYEWSHLRAKLAARSPAVLARWEGVTTPDPHPLFVVVPGPIADWEVVAGTG